MAALGAIPQPQLPDVGCDAIRATVVEWKRTTRLVYADEFSELWVGDYDLEYGYDSSGKLVAQRDATEPFQVRVFDHRPGVVAVFVGWGTSFAPFALLERHLDRFRVTAVWYYPSQKVPKTVRYVDGEFGVERIIHEEPDGSVNEQVYERGVDGRLVRVVMVSGGEERVLWPMPGKATVAHALGEVVTLAAPVSDAIRRVASTSKAGLCVLSFTPDEFYLPPILSWLPAEEIASLRTDDVHSLWEIAEWSQVDMKYLPQEEAIRFLALNNAVYRRPRVAEKALVALSRSIEAGLRAEGFQCVVAALPLEVAEGHERRVKKQVSSHEWTLLRTWGLVR